MGTIGGLISAHDEAREAHFTRALSRSSRGKTPTVLSRGSVTIGAAAGPLEDASLGTGSVWSVAVSGVIDSVVGRSQPAQPAGEIAAAFDRIGIEASRTILGDFTCLATDGTRLIAFRDHLGTDGLFVGSLDSVTAVMSEPKQVVAAIGLDRKPNIDALVAMYFSQWEAEDDVPCVVQDVDRVPRGFVVEATEAGWRRIGRVWDPANVVETANITLEEAKERAWELFSAAIDRSVSGPTAVSLSGGIDSTVIAAALATKTCDEQIGAISAVYPESPSVDESHYIADTASMLGLPSTTYQPARGRLSNLDTWVDRCDGPTHGLALGAIEEMNEQAGSANFRTVLSGEMGELVYDLREHAIGRMLMRGHLVAAGRNLSQLRDRGIPWSSLTRIVGATLTPSRLALAYTRRQPVGPPAPWLDPEFMPGLERRWDLERPPSRRWHDIQLFFAIGPSYPGLETSTIMGDFAGVRTRRPLVDRELWEFFLSLPAHIKFPDAWTKSLVRRVLNGRAPDSVVWRKDKTVFDEDSKRNADRSELIERINDGFELPGVDYPGLLRHLEGAEMSGLELALVRNLVSMHAFVGIA